MSGNNEIFKKIAVLKAQKEDFEAKAEVIGGIIAQLSQEAYSQLIDSGLKQVRISGDLFTDHQERIISPDVKVKPNVVDQPRFFKFLREHNFGAIIKESVHHTTLEKWVGERMDQNMSLPDESILRVFSIETVNIRRAPKK